MNINRWLGLFWWFRRVFWDALFPLAVLIVATIISFWVIRAPPVFFAAGDKYDIFKDLIIVLLTLWAIAGVAIWYIVRKTTEDAVRCDIDRRFSQNEGRIFLTAGMLHWTQRQNLLRSTGYFPSLPQKDPTLLGEITNELEHAIRFTRRSIEANSIPQVDMAAKNNLAYFLAARHAVNKNRWNDKAEAEKSIKDAIQLASTHDPQRLTGFHVTYFFVRARFAESLDEAKQVNREIEEAKFSPRMERFRPELDESLRYLQHSFLSLSRKKLLPSPLHTLKL